MLNLNNLYQNILKLAVLSLFVAVYYADILSATMGLQSIRLFGIALFLIVYLLWLMVFLSRGLTSLPKEGVLFFAVSLILLCLFAVSLFLQPAYLSINFYIGVLVAIIVYLQDYKFFKKLIFITLVLQILLQTIEFYLGEYVYVAVAEIGGNLLELDEQLYGGADNIFRAKGIFKGPLSAVGYAIGAALLFRKKFSIITLALISSLLAAGRLGILVNLIILFLFVFRTWEAKIDKRTITLSASLAALVVIFFAFVDVQRMMSVFSFDNAQNAARMFYWGAAFDTFAKYSFFEKLFGHAGYYRELVNNSPESSWLELLLDTGVLGLAAYLMVVVFVAMRSINKQLINLAYLGILFVTASVYTHFSAFSLNLLFWLAIIDMYKESLSGRRKIAKRLTV